MFTVPTPSESCPVDPRKGEYRAATQSALHAFASLLSSNAGDTSSVEVQKAAMLAIKQVKEECMSYRHSPGVFRLLQASSDTLQTLLSGSICHLHTPSHCSHHQSLLSALYSLLRFLSDTPLSSAIEDACAETSQCFLHLGKREN